MEDKWWHEEQRLVKKAKSGHQSSFERLMNHYMKNIYNYIRMHVGSQEDVKDVLQETLLGAFNSIEQFNEESSIKTWLIGITRRKIADYYRSKYKREDHQVPEDVIPYLGFDQRDAVDEHLEIFEAIDKLQEEEKELVHLVFIQQLSYKDINALIGLPIGTIKSKVHTIKDKLRRLIE